MSLYNCLFGFNKNAGLLLEILELDSNRIERFRDISVLEDGKHFNILTRTGGGNREDFPNEYLTSHPLYISDEDDEYDSTYAHYIFKIPDEFQRLFKNAPKSISLNEKFDLALKSMEIETFKQRKKDITNEEILDVLNRLKQDIKNAIDMEKDGKNMWILKLNHMRDRWEVLQTIGWAETKEALVKYVEENKAEKEYTSISAHIGFDNYKFNHYFKQGSRLEWYNPPTNEEYNFEYFGTLDEILERTRQQYNMFKNTMFKIGE